MLLMKVRSRTVPRGQPSVDRVQTSESSPHDQACCRAQERCSALEPLGAEMGCMLIVHRSSMLGSTGKALIDFSVLSRRGC